jgi:hypothetical protein
MIAGWASLGPPPAAAAGVTSPSVAATAGREQARDERESQFHLVHLAKQQVAGQFLKGIPREGRGVSPRRDRTRISSAATGQSDFAPECPEPRHLLWSDAVSHGDHVV